MELSNEELIRSAYDALNRRDLEGFLELVDPEVEFNSLIAEADARSFHGHEGVREWWRTVLSSLGGLHWELEGVRGLDGGFGLVKMRVAGKAQDVPIEQDMWMGTRRRGEKAVWWYVGRTEAEALEAMRRAGYED